MFFDRQRFVRVPARPIGDAVTLSVTGHYYITERILKVY